MINVAYMDKFGMHCQDYEFNEAVLVVGNLMVYKDILPSVYNHYTDSYEMIIVPGGDHEQTHFGKELDKYLDSLED